MRDDDVRLDLEEVDSADALAGPDRSGRSETEGADDARRPGRRRLRGWRAAVAAVGVVLVLAAVGGALALRDAQELGERREALERAGLPLVDLASPLAEAWRLEDSRLAAATADLLVVRSTTESGSVWRGVDPATGQVRWEAPGAEGWSRAWNPQDGGGSGPSAASSDPTRLAVVDARFGDGPPAPAAVTDVRVLDLATGAQTGTLSFVGDVVAMEPVGESVVAVAVGPEGTFSVARADLSGGLAWAARTEFSTAGQGAVPTLGVAVVDAVVYLVSLDGVPVAAFDLGTGAAVEPVGRALPSPTARLALPDGGRAESFVSVQQLADGRYYLGRPVVVVSSADGVERFRANGRLVVTAFTDGSAPDRLLLARFAYGPPATVAVDVETGVERWSAPALLTARLLVGGVLVGESDGFVALDLATGDRLWRFEASVGMPGVPVTDGGRILVLADRGAPELVSLDIRTGGAVWSVPAPRAVTDLTAVPGGAVVTTPDALVAYR